MGSQRKGSNDLYQYRDTDLDGKRHKAKKIVWMDTRILF